MDFYELTKIKKIKLLLDRNISKKNLTLIILYKNFFYRNISAFFEIR